MSLEQTKLDDILLIRKVAVGGMAELWEGRQTGVESFEKSLAVKLLLPHLAQDEEFVRLFLDEARLAAQLNHTNICQIYKLGEADGRYYIAMELIEGNNITNILRRAAQRRVFLPLGFACQIMLGVCEALGYAHALTGRDGRPLGIVHRDLSPPNVMVTKDGHVKVIDFGIAKAATQTHHTPTDIMRGKFAYMSPEYVFELPLDARSDLFSMGVVFWELTTGRRLFQADTEYAKMRKITQGNYPRPSKYRRDIPPHLESIIMRALCFEREERYPSCAMMQEDIERYLLAQSLALSPRRLASFNEWLFSDNDGPPPTPMSGQFPAFQPLDPISAQEHQIAAMPLTQSPSVAVPSLQLAMAPGTLGQAPTAADNTTPQMPVLSSPSRGRSSDVEISASLSRPKVLIADDHKQIRDSLDMILTAQGYQVAVAKDGLEALTMLKMGPFDVCILDLAMPKLNGKDTLKQIRLLCPSLPCIIQTSDNSFQTATDMGRSGAFSYLVKPIKSKELLAAIEKARRHRPSGEELDQAVHSFYPTPLAEPYHSYERLPHKPSSLRQRHAQLASQFEVYTSWLGSVALAAYLEDGAFDPALNLRIQEYLGRRIQPGDWLRLLHKLESRYRECHKPHFAHALRDVLRPESWSAPLEQARLESLFEQLAPQLAIPPSQGIPSPYEALSLLAEYHGELWRHDAHLSNDDVAQNIDCIEPLIRSLYRMIYRLADFSFVCVDAVEASEHGIHHDLTLLQGLTPSSSSQILPSGLDLRGLYVFNVEHTPMFSLFPFLISGPCQAKDCGRVGISHLVQLKDQFQGIYQNMTCGHLQRLNDAGSHKVQQRLSSLFSVDVESAPMASL